MNLSSLRLSLLLLTLIISACGSSGRGVQEDLASESTTESVDELISLAYQTTGDERAAMILRAAELLAEQGTADLNVLQLNEQIVTETDNPTLRARLAILLAEYYLSNQRSEAVLDLLASLDQTEVAVSERIEIESLVGDSYLQLEDFESALDAYLAAEELGPLSQATSNRIWQLLSRLNAAQLQTLASNAADYQLRGWIELARVNRGNQASLRGQLDAIAQWQRIWAQHAAVNVLPTALLDLSLLWEQRPRQIALLLPIQQPAGLAIQEGLLSAYYLALEETREVPGITVYDTSNASDISPLYNQALEEGADLIIGPLNKTFVNRLHREEQLPVPTLALNYADSNEQGPANLFQFGLAPEDEISQAAEIARQLGYHNAAVLTPNSADYDRLQAIFAQTWQNLGGQLVSRTSFVGDGDYAEVVKRLMAIDSSEARAERLLEILPRSNMEFIPRRRSDVDFIFLIANPRQGRQIKPTLSFYFAEDVPVFALPSIYDGQNNQSANQDLNGIIFTDAPWLLDRDNSERRLTDRSLRTVQGPLQRLRALGVDSYRLHARLSQFENGALGLIPGVTGELSITMDRRIHRRLQPAHFENGIAEPLTLESFQPGD